jgi:hypothetical protein
MKHALKLSAVLLLLAPMAWAADSPKATPKTNLLDYSAPVLISGDAAKKVMADNIPARVWALFPASKYTFISQVEGGLTSGGACVVTARVMLMPLTPTAKAVLFRPQKSATAFDTLAGASAAQCATLAQDKLKEATAAVVSSLVKT